MATINQPLRLQINQNRSYISVTDEEMEVGFCTPEFAARIIETFNEYEQLQEDNETLNKALRMACLDLIRMSGGKMNQLDRRMRHYVERAKRPEHGTRAIAYLLRERQRELKISNRDFVRFCYSYKLTPQELESIFKGKDVSDNQLKVLARILGKSVEELTEVRDGFSSNELNMLARILGTSNEELTKLFKS